MKKSEDMVAVLEWRIYNMGASIDRLMEVWCVTDLAKLMAMNGYNEKAKDINVMVRKILQ